MGLTRYDIDQLCLFDDEMFRLCLKDCPEGIEYIIRTILDKPDLKVINSKIQKYIGNSGRRSVCFDVYAEDSSDNSRYNIEIQNSREYDLPRRSRYYSSMIDARLTLVKSEPFRNLPDSYVIFICRDDIMGSDIAMRRFTRICRQTGEELSDGTNIIFVNGSYEGKDNIGNLIRDFKETDPSKINSKILADRVGTVKGIHKQGGVSMVRTHFDDLLDKAMSEGLEQGGTENAISTAKRMLAKDKYTLDEIAEITALPLDKVKELAGSMPA